MLAQPELTQSTLFKMAEEGRHFQEKIAKNTIEKLMEIEELGEEILTEKHQVGD